MGDVHKDMSAFATTALQDHQMTAGDRIMETSINFREATHVATTTTARMAEITPRPRTRVASPMGSEPLIEDQLRHPAWQ
jgi:hypothetical protein